MKRVRYNDSVIHEIVVEQISSARHYRCWPLVVAFNEWSLVEEAAQLPKNLRCVEFALAAAIAIGVRRRVIVAEII